jgi:hypothetical protein
LDIPKSKSSVTVACFLPGRAKDLSAYSKEMMKTNDSNILEQSEKELLWQILPLDSIL